MLTNPTSAAIKNDLKTLLNPGQGTQLLPYVTNGLPYNVPAVLSKGNPHMVLKYFPYLPNLDTRKPDSDTTKRSQNDDFEV